MGLDGSDQLSGERRPVVDDECVARTQHGPASCRKQGVASPVPSRKRQIVERRAVRFDDDPVFDQQIHAPDSVKPHLRAHSKAEVEGNQACDRLEPGFRAPVRRAEFLSSSAR